MIHFILADLRRLWMGAAVVVLLVALSTALGVCLNLQERALRLGSARAADKFDVVIGAAGSGTQLELSSVFLQAAALPLMPGAVLEKLANDPRVAWAAPVGFGDSFSGYPVVGTTTRLVAEIAPGFREGRMFRTEGEAVVGSAVTLPLGAEIKPMHGTAETGGRTHTELVYRVSGQLQPTGTPWEQAIIVPIQAVWHVHGLGGANHTSHDDQGHDDQDHAGHAHGEHDHDADGDGGRHVGHPDADAPLSEDVRPGTPGLPAILVKPKTIADAYKLRQDYRSGETTAVFPGEVLTALYATLGDARRILSAVSGGPQVLVAAALLMVTVTHIGQRKRQIGALRAFGAPRLAVFSIAWLELFLLIAVGVALGFLCGWAAARAISWMLTTQSGVVLPVEFARDDIWLGLSLLGASAVAAAVPAWLAYRQSPAASLRASI